jgi:hypothetical protein
MQCIATRDADSGANPGEQDDAPEDAGDDLFGAAQRSGSDRDGGKDQDAPPATTTRAGRKTRSPSRKPF